MQTLGRRLINCLDFRSTSRLINCVDRSRFIMTTDSNGKDHFEAIVHQIFDISPTVKKVVLKVNQTNVPFQFLPGQWLDVFIPNCDTIGGFSLTSTPKQLTSDGTLDLAVKYSDSPPATWVRTQCKQGSKVTIRSGGDFFLPDDPQGDILFVAGGVGINPIASMIFHLADIHYNYNIQLLYSAKSVSELLFKEQFNGLAKTGSKFDVKYFVTQPNNTENKSDDEDTTRTTSSSPYENRRISIADLEKFMTLDKTTYICGPPPFIQFVMESSHKCKMIHFEKWW